MYKEIILVSKSKNKQNKKYILVHNLLNFNLKLINKKNLLFYYYLTKFNVFNFNTLTNLYINYNIKLVNNNKNIKFLLYNKLLNKFIISIKHINIKLYNFKFIIILKKLITLSKILKKNFNIITSISKKLIKNILNIFYTYIKINSVKSINEKNKSNSTIVLNLNKKHNIKYSNIITKSYFKTNSIFKFLLKHNKKENINNIIYNFYKLSTNLIFGQNKNIKKISNELLNSIYNNSNKPIANWLFCGPSGTGKTELSKIISKYIYKNDNNLIHLDMSEYKESHSVSRLIGSAPGYVGSDSNENLVTDITNKPKSVVLFDEIEKANIDIYPIFLQILDEGILTDSKGNIGKFNKSIIIFTSNLGSDIVKSMDINSIYDVNYENKIKDSIKEYFAPELINRLDNIIIFKSLNTYNTYSMFNKFIQYIFNIKVKKQSEYKISLISCSPIKGSRFLLNNSNVIKFNTYELENIILYNNKLIKCYLI